MPRTRDLLDRFRPAGTPGAAAGGGVPADRTAELSAELLPVLDLLADAVEAAGKVREDALAEAGHRRGAARERARVAVAAARQEAEAERAEAAARVSEQVAEETAATAAAAQQQAEELRRSAQGRLPGYADRVVAAVRSALEEPRAASPEPRADAS